MSIKIVDLSHVYDLKTPNETIAINHIDLDVETGEFIGLIGHTGSGKSTLIQQMNGLLKPSSGEIIISGYNITEGLNRPINKKRK